MLREFLTREVFARIVTALRTDDAELRASLAASQMMGLVVARYVVGIEPLASLEPDAIVGLVAPILQAYLTGPLPALTDWAVLRSCRKTLAGVSGRSIFIT